MLLLWRFNGDRVQLAYAKRLEMGRYFIARKEGSVVDLRVGDLIFVRGVGFVSKAIEGVTKSPYSHVAGLVKPNELLESNGFRRIGYEALDRYKGCADIFTCDLATEKQREQMVRNGVKEINDPYDWLLIPWQLIRYLLGWKLPYSEGKSRECSTFWSRLYRQVGIDLCPGVRYPSPGDLAESKMLRKVGSL